MPGVTTRVTDLIGRTPLFELAATDTGTRLFLKLENMNPTGAAKIRMAKAMIDDAEARGLLRPGGHIIESTSGNTGLGLAVIAAERGYRFTAVVDHHACPDKLRTMRTFGAQLVFAVENNDGSLSTTAREELAEKLADDERAAAERAGLEPNTYFTEQHNNDANPLGYYDLADELLTDLGRVDVLISAVGTGGSLFGTGRRLRQLGLEPLMYGVEPVGSIAFGGPAGPYWQSGTGTPEGADPGKTVEEDLNLLKEGVKVSDVEAFATARVVAAKLGLLIGGSSGGSVFAALDRMDEFPAGSIVVTIVGDGGEKYLDTVFDDEWMSDRDLLDSETEGEVAKMLDRYTPARGCAARDGGRAAESTHAILVPSTAGALASNGAAGK
ncbi:pyridoxal-phosphate dependent enzyme [Nocardia sp. SYP-A9097]|uniref:cysteine synthase family protein n=1 Tax=Nocardia sp. SYP-A9097 TaxID=2663237 RepID=UPI00129A4CBE|nr:cysteine synthase family protein [Nocardia sp. SYP-A9097]MRH86785.1 pyridoxal-phosphate dependent enzyme [Nocardia sp. SYP-A9097]